MASLIPRLVVASNNINITSTPKKTSRPVSHCSWDEVSMIQAMRAVDKEGMSVRRAAEMFDVPKSSLHDRITGKIQHGTRAGRAPYLTRKEEDELVIFLLKCADMGYPHTIAQILGLVQQTLEYKGIKETVTHGWWQRFCQRHTEISLRTAMPLSMARARATDHNCTEKYYDLLEHTLKHNITLREFTIVTKLVCLLAPRA